MPGRAAGPLRLALAVLVVLAMAPSGRAGQFAPPVQEPVEPTPQQTPEQPGDADPVRDADQQDPGEQDPADSPPRPASAWQRVERLADRLEALDGRDAMAYLELAEEVASETGSPEDRLLARQLFALAYAVERTTKGRPQVMASACLGLAWLDPSDEGSAWLRAVAGLLAPHQAQPATAQRQDLPVDPKVALDAASALGLARSGEGRRAARLYEDPAVREVFERYGRLLGGTGGLSGLSRFERAMRDWPDLECGGSRVVTRRGEDGVQTLVCPTCRGNPGPPMNEQEYLSHLRFESRLLNGIHQSWGAQLVADGNAPLLDPDPDRVPELLAARYGVDPTSPYWRNGRWQPQPPDPTNQPTNQPTDQPAPGQP
ncbi:MAG: hypothetical protein KatS3mg103_0764 [Phycisphaerales bacterium]|nr:MAG: hypothetical protein KatS3mg103_0764 [Phycisphaerales bacterium]